MKMRTEAQTMCDALMNSEAYVGDAAIPVVAEDAAELIRRMSAELTRLEAACEGLVAEGNQLFLLAQALYDGLNDASSVIDAGEGESFAYQAPLEAAREYFEAATAAGMSPYQQSLAEAGLS